MDRNKLNGMKHWKCPANPAHILGVLRRVESSTNVDGHQIRYYTSQVMLFKESIDLDGEMPTEFEVMGVVEGLMLTSMTWKCTCCGATKKWHPGEEALMWLIETYGARK